MVRRAEALAVPLVLTPAGCYHRSYLEARYVLDAGAFADAVIALRAARPDTDAGEVLGSRDLAGVALGTLGDGKIREVASRWSGAFEIWMHSECDSFFLVVRTADGPEPGLSGHHALLKDSLRLRNIIRDNVEHPPDVQETWRRTGDTIWRPRGPVEVPFVKQR